MFTLAQTGRREQRASALSGVLPAIIWPETISDSMGPEREWLAQCQRSAKTGHHGQRRVVHVLTEHLSHVRAGGKWRRASTGVDSSAFPDTRAIQYNNSQPNPLNRGKHVVVVRPRGSMSRERIATRDIRLAGRHS
jgi:hypothetical protein